MAQIILPGARIEVPFLLEHDVVIVSGVRCSECSRFFQVAEGNYLPICCPYGHYTLEYHLTGCLDYCSPECQCPCHRYRERKS